VYLQEANFNKPIWASYTNDMQDVEKLVHYMPISMQKFIKRSLPGNENFEKISLGVDTTSNADLPKLPEGKRLTCPNNTTISELIEFLSENLKFNKHFIVA